jgi:EAL domain-containing protein (putative c-di-GMP-specific phosphodiesterase class I)
MRGVAAKAQTEGGPRVPEEAVAGGVLLVDDEPTLLRAYARALTEAGHRVATAADGHAAVELFQTGQFDVVLSDIAMPGMDGVQLLRAVRERDLDVPVVLVTGSPDVRTALEAVEHGALRYLIKPVEISELCAVVARAVQLHRLAKLKREALEHLAGGPLGVGDRAGLEATFKRALDSLWMAFQPIVDWQNRRVFGFEALVRSQEPALPHPGALFDAAERLDKLQELGRQIRAQTAAAAPHAPPGAVVFVNLHPKDLLDDDLYHPDSPLSAIAGQVVLELTERASLDVVKDLASRVAHLRRMGFRLAIDDLGAGYAGLTAFAQLEPEVVKLDMSLVRDVHKSATKRKLIQSMTSLCHDLGMQVVAEGVETIEERDALAELGADLLQGYFFARPAKGFPPVAF